MTPKSGLAAAVLVVALATPAWAHLPFPGTGAFYNGLAHPLLVPASLLAIVGLGLLIGQHSPASAQYALPAFVIAFLAAFLFPPMASASIVEAGTVALALVAGLCVAMALNFGAYVSAAIAAAIGVLIGTGQKQDAVIENLSWLSLAGSAAGAAVALTLLAGFVAALRRPWQRIGIRVLGSWTAASAFLVLALALASI